MKKNTERRRFVITNRSIIYEYTPNQLQELLDNSDSYSDILRKIGINPKGGNPKTLKKIIAEYKLDETQLNINRRHLYSRNAKNVNLKLKVSTEEILAGKLPNYNSVHLLNRLINEGYKEYKCEICGISDWQDKPLKLHLHHKDGNHTNNCLTNLQVLCPNCHSQTETFAGKNMKKYKRTKRMIIQEVTKKKLIIKKPPVSREDLKELIRTKPFIAIGEMFNVSDNAIRKWCDKYGLPRKATIIKKITDSDWELI